MKDPEGVLTGKRKASTCVFGLKPLYGLISKCSRRLNERQTYRDNSFGDTKDASVSNKTSVPLLMVCFADDLLMIFADPGSTLGATLGVTPLDKSL